MNPTGDDDRSYEDVKTEVDETIEDNAVVLFMKGTELMPQCGYSRTALNILQQYSDVTAVNVMDALDQYREALEEHTGWTTIPQAFHGGEFIGGADVLKQLHEAGDLEDQLGTIETNGPF